MAVERIIGIDFGTSTSVIRVKRYKDGQPVGDPLEVKQITFDLGSTMVPTLVQKRDTGETVYFGYDANIPHKKTKTFSNFKVDLENSDPEIRQQAKELTSEFFAYMAKVYKAQSDGGHLGESSDQEYTIISYPVKWSEETKAFMQETAKAAGFPNVEGLDEARAAIQAVTVQNVDMLRKKGYFKDGIPATILLIDMGAGTTDLVLCRHTPGGTPKTEILCTWPQSGNTLFGGSEVDKILCNMIGYCLPEDSVDMILRKLNTEKFKTWKERNISPALSKKESVEEFSALDDITDFLGIEVSYSVNRESFETAATEYLQEFPELINDCLKNGKLTGNDVDLVILTGGHSQWYFVQEMLLGKMNQFGAITLDKIQKDTDRIIPITLPQETVALGLVYGKLVPSANQLKADTTMPNTTAQKDIALHKTEEQSENVWRQSDTYNVPRMIFINKMDIIGANFYGAVEQIRRLVKNPIVLQLPICKENDFRGIIDLFEMKAYIYNDDKGNDVTVCDIPEDMKKQAEEYHIELIEKICELDDELMMQHLEGEEIAVADPKAALRKGCCECNAIPVFCEIEGMDIKGTVENLIDKVESIDWKSTVDDFSENIHSTLGDFSENVKSAFKNRGNNATQKQIVAKNNNDNNDSSNITIDEETLRQYILMAERGNVDVQYNLGECYYSGNGTKKDINKAIKWFTSAANQGHSGAQFRLGECYNNGIGVTVNGSEAVKWYKMAAEQGHPESQYKLGDCYYYGNGVNRNDEEAEKWYKMAADRGHLNAQNQLKNAFAYITIKRAKKFYGYARVAIFEINGEKYYFKNDDSKKMRIAPGLYKIKLGCKNLKDDNDNLSNHLYYDLSIAKGDEITAIFNIKADKVDIFLNGKFILSWPIGCELLKSK